MKLLPPIFHLMLLLLTDKLRISEQIFLEQKTLSFWRCRQAVSHPHAYCTVSDGSTSVSGLCRTYIFCVRTAEPWQPKLIY